MSVNSSRVKLAIREAVAWAFHASSIPHWRHRGKVVVLMYHRVLAREEVSLQSVQPGMYVLDSVFAQHMSFLFSLFGKTLVIDVDSQGYISSLLGGIKTYTAVAGQRARLTSGPPGPGVSSSSRTRCPS